VQQERGGIGASQGKGLLQMMGCGCDISAAILVAHQLACMPSQKGEENLAGECQSRADHNIYWYVFIVCINQGSVAVSINRFY
jgi:hypothetical protein